MKHFIKKIALMGAGGSKKQKPSPPPDPPRLDPPIYGKYKSYPSYSSAEIVDLICDGPIEGLVNEAGAKLINENILQGIYFDNTPISSVRNAGSSSTVGHPFREETHSGIMLSPLSEFCKQLNSIEYATPITPPRAASLWFGPDIEVLKDLYKKGILEISEVWSTLILNAFRNAKIERNKNGQLPYTSAKENIGSLITITESFSKLRADGLAEKKQATQKKINELTNQLNKLDDLEAETRKKFTEEKRKKNTLLYQKEEAEDVISALKIQLNNTPNNKANKKQRDDLNKKIKNAESILKNINSDLGKVNKTISSLDIDGKEDKQEDLFQKRSEERQKLAILKDELDKIPGKQKQNRSKKQKEIDAVEKRIKDITSQIQSLEKQLEKLGNFNKIEKIENQIENQKDVLNGIRFDWTPVDNSQNIEVQYNTLNILANQGTLRRNPYPDGGFPSWSLNTNSAFKLNKIQLHFRDETADGPNEKWNLYWWENYFNELLTTLTNENLQFEKAYVKKILNKVKKLKDGTHVDSIVRSKDINNTFSNFVKRQNPLLIYSIGDRGETANNILKSGGATSAEKATSIDDLEAGFYIDTLQEHEDRIVYTCIVPKTKWEGGTEPNYTGDIYGFIAISFKESTRVETTKWQTNAVSYDNLDTTLNMTNAIGAVGIKDTASEIFKKNASKSKYDVEHEIRIYKTRLTAQITQQLSLPFKLKFSRSFVRFVLNKYNFNNVLNEFRPGEERQKPLAFFNAANVDTEVNYKLTGPFRRTGSVRKLRVETNMLDRNPSLHYGNSPPEDGGSPNLLLRVNAEGGQDIRKYSKIVKGQMTETDSISYHSDLDVYNEDAVPFTHYIENPDVDEVIVSIEIKQLTDIITVETKLDPSTKSKGSQYTDQNKVYADTPGTKIPAVLNLRIDIGYVVNENFTSQEEISYKIIGLVESPVLIDIGNYENKFYEDSGAYLPGGGLGQSQAKGPFVAHPSDQTRNNPSRKIKFTTPITNALRLQGAKRYVKIYKVSVETNSVALRREVFVSKITEIIPLNFSYPFSALVASKIDARNFTSIPTRSFDCRLKKIMIPSNYFPLQEEFPHKEKRYWETVRKHTDALVDDKMVYKGDWNGELKLGWTDNPAWILYDILTNVRYGLGEYLESSSINIWEIYKIGRYCDAVNDDGLFIGVKDLYGGLEPRFSCNIIFSETTKIFDAVNTIINLFRGNIFFSNSELHFSDDRPREPISLFTNSNVANGFFNYTNNKKDESFNVVEVAYLDKLDNFKTKIEVVKDEDDIRYRGYAKTVVNTFGVTSKSMARRIGQHIIWQTTKENQGIEFTTGPEALLCRPGDLIVIEDEMKSRVTNYGRILDVDSVNRTLTLDNPVDLNSLENKITIYTPTGYKTTAEIERLSDASRQRIDQFKVSNNDPALTPLNNRVFKFSHYSTQYYPEDIYKASGYQNAVYVDTNDKTRSWYYDLNNRAWIYSIGTTKTYITEDISQGVGIQDITKLYSYLETATEKRGSFIKSPQLIYNEHYWTGALNGKPTIGGVHDDEIRTQNNRQITTYSISGVSALSSDTEINNGSLVFLHQNNFNLNLLDIVEPGSTYRLQVKNTTDQIYKVLSIRENNPNEYNIVGTKYDSGKWETIENDVYIEGVQQQYNQSLFKVVNGYSQPEKVLLDISSRNETNYVLVGEWYPPASEQGLTYSVSLENPNIGFFNEQIINSQNQGAGPYKIYYSGLNDQGLWIFRTQVISKDPLKYNSYFSTAKKFIGIESSNPDDLNSPVINIVRAI